MKTIIELTPADLEEAIQDYLNKIMEHPQKIRKGMLTCSSFDEGEVPIRHEWDSIHIIIEDQYPDREKQRLHIGE